MTRVIVVRGILMLFVCWVAAAAVGCSEVQVLPVTVEQRYEPVPTPEFIQEASVRA